ncbi:MAG: aspartyl protease family protein [Acidobacteriota bacterium]
MSRKDRQRAKKEAARKERIRQEKHQKRLDESKERQASGAGALAPPSFIDLVYGSVDMLHAVGPLVPAAWTIPAALEETYKENGSPVPSAVHGFLLIDTGATRTCISLEAAAELHLNARRVIRTHGAGGLTENAMFWARLQIDIENARRDVTTAELDQEVAGIPGLEANYDRRDVKFSKGHGVEPTTKVRLIGLLGRDFLRHATLIYEGSQGHVRLSLDRESFRPKPPQA